jgi:ketosteroid isomerase-like protein
MSPSTGRTIVTDPIADAPQVIATYLKAADERDAETLVACFTPGATVLDEGRTYRGPDEIRRWRTEGPAAQFDYTTTITASDRDGPAGYRVEAHVEGNFPGGVADLRYHFLLAGDEISELKILE